MTWREAAKRVNKFLIREYPDMEIVRCGDRGDSYGFATRVKNLEPGDIILGGPGEFRVDKKTGKITVLGTDVITIEKHMNDPYTLIWEADS